MSLITTIGADDADSYVTADEAFAYCESRGITSLSDFSGSAIEPFLRVATQYMDGNYRGQIKGRKTSAEQALAFPRIGCSDEDGNVFDDDVIPKVWKFAVIEAAAKEAESAGTLFTTLDRLTQSEKIGPISVTYVAGSSATAELTVLDSLVSGLLTTGGGEAFVFFSRA